MAPALSDKTSSDFAKAYQFASDRVGFVHARDEPKARCGVPEFSLDANDRA